MDDNEHKLFIKGMKTFLRLCKQELGLERLPKIVWVTNDDIRKENPTFGRFTNKDETVMIDIRHRHPIDVMRTLAHELTHYKQWLSGQITPSSGETGSKQENEANAMAGIIMRHYDRSHPDAFELKPLD